MTDRLIKEIAFNALEVKEPRNRAERRGKKKDEYSSSRRKKKSKG